MKCPQFQGLRHLGEACPHCCYPLVDDRAIDNRVPAAEPHPDDAAVDRFAALMKAKLRQAREEKGRGGWQDVPAWQLSEMLLDHVRKGDPVDVANFCMMLSDSGKSITTLG